MAEEAERILLAQLAERHRQLVAAMQDLGRALDGLRDDPTVMLRLRPRREAELDVLRALTSATRACARR